MSYKTIVLHLDDGARCAMRTQTAIGLAARFGSRATHGVHVEVRREGPPEGVGDRLLSLAADVGADLIVAGGHGHSRLRERVLGGVTRDLLERMNLPTLLSH